jgi:DnaJ-class molecular chaperone
MSAIMKNWKYYMEILDLEPTYVVDKKSFLDKQYRPLAKKYHPDKCKNLPKSECEKKFKEISDARDFLNKNYTEIQENFTDYLHKTFEKYLPFEDGLTASFVTDNAELLGKAFYTFGELDGYLG